MFVISDRGRSRGVGFIFGAMDVPVIYYATKIWETDHPTTRVVGSLPQAMWNTLFFCLAAQLCLAIAFVWIRARQQRVSIELDETWGDGESWREFALRAEEAAETGRGAEV